MGVAVFTVSAFVEPGAKLGLIGSVPELGSWNIHKCIPMTNQQEVYSAFVPSCFSCQVDLEQLEWVVDPITGTCSKFKWTGQQPIRFKFVRWGDNGGVPTPEFRLPEPSPLTGRKYGKAPFSVKDFELKIKSNPFLMPPHPDEEVVWEGEGPHHDRAIGPEWLLSGSEQLGSVHIIDQANLYVKGNFLPKGVTEDCKTRANSGSVNDDDDEPTSVYLVPAYDFLEPYGGLEATSEYARTTRYYLRVKHLRTIHFHKVVPGIYVGTCPRDEKHLLLLKNTYNVGLVVNLQTHDDIKDNWINNMDREEDRNTYKLQTIYAKHKISLIHLPTEDMSTPGRAQLMAQTACLIAAALAADPCRGIYIHCNAGVGRAVATVCSFLRYVVGLSEAHTCTLVKVNRTTAFLDREAMRLGFEDFGNKFKGMLQYLPLVE